MTCLRLKCVHVYEKKYHNRKLREKTLLMCNYQGNIKIIFNKDFLFLEKKTIYNTWLFLSLSFGNNGEIS